MWQRRDAWVLQSVVYARPGGNLRTVIANADAINDDIPTQEQLERAVQLLQAAGLVTQIAIVAVARKLAMLCWQLLTRQQDYAFQRPTLVARKLRTLELRAGAPHATTTSTAPRASTAKQRAAQERQLAEQAEHAYQRLIADWNATGPNKGAGAAPGRASQGPSNDQAARQAPAPEPAL